MLTYKNLADLAQALAGRTVLSVYVNGEERDPAKRRRWRIDLRHSLDDIESWLKGSSHADREAFAACRRMLMERFETARGMLLSPGWAAFFTTDGEYHSGPVPAAVPTMAAWSTGPCLTPYVRALKEARAVLVVVIDSRRARLYRYAERKVTLVETVRARTVLDHPSHMSAPPRPGFHTGTRGATGADQAQRELRNGTTHMLAEVLEKVSQLAADSEWVVVGGIPEVAKAFLSRLPADMKGRAAQAERLDVHAKRSEVADVARETASQLRDAKDLQRIDEIHGGAARNGRGVIGSVDTRGALTQGRAREIYFTLRFLEQHAAAAEEIVQLALGNHAQVEQVSGQAAMRLDEAGGVAARLRYAAVAAAPEVAA